MGTEDFGKTTSNYPAPLSLRVMGEARQDFSGLVLEIVQKHIPEIDESQLKIRPSRGGKFISVMVTFRVENKEQFSMIYQELQRNDRILMIL
jgi:uncharacterized protein